MGKVIGIATRIEKRAPMVVYASAKVTFDKGVGDDSRGLIKGDRQVTVMTVESWEAVCAELDRKLHWTTRRANILIEGVDLENTTGNLLKIGKFQLEITGELKPCNRMEEQKVGLTKALTPNWRGGVMCKILSEGVVSENDQVTLGEKA
ncbi:MAG: MOSC domain-containing protein [Flavobacteriales bacterium]|nr:MAG: MOSC domain-containing protein [Flavobacteriales bacterium]